MELKKNVSKKEMERAKEIFDEAEDCLIVVSDKGHAFFGKKTDVLAPFSLLVYALSEKVPEEMLESAFRTGLQHTIKISEISEIENIKELLELLEKLEKITKEL